jgi:hypothetical protein
MTPHFTFEPGAESGVATAQGYAAGTRILTATGEVPVELLVEGDRAVTMNSFGLSEIRWVGRMRIDDARHPARAPVRIRAHAFARGRPHHDLVVSPGHTVAVDGALIPARRLVNGATVAREAVNSITYHHIAFEHHDVVLAEGMPAESFLDASNRGGFTACGAGRGAGGLALRRCAPVVDDGAMLEAVRATLLLRARDLGLAPPRLREMPHFGWLRPFLG